MHEMFIALLELLAVLVIVNVMVKLFFRHTLVGKLTLECLKGIVALVGFMFRTIRNNLNCGIKYTKGFNDYINRLSKGNIEKPEEKKHIENEDVKKVVNENVNINVVDIKRKRKSINKV